MALHDNPPHRITLQSSASGTDSGGGVQLTYTTVQSSVPASISTASASERDIFAQQGIVVSHTIGLLTSALTTAPARGWKVLDESGNSYHVRGISAGRSYGSVPPFHYLFCEQQI